MMVKLPTFSFAATINVEITHFIRDPADERFQILFIRMRKPSGFSISRGQGKNIDGGQFRLLSRRHEHDNRILRAISQNTVVNGFRHRNQPCCIVSDVESLKWKTS